MSSLYDATYNPDILTCLANLSNDEVFTPPTVANQMLDMLPQELFKSPDTKFLDPGCKSGVFLREIAKRLIEGEKNIYPNLNERIDHIMHEQLFGIAITEITSLMSRRSLYCSKYPNGIFSISKFKTVDGNIRFKKTDHLWKNGKCIYCGASQEQYDRDKQLESHAYEFIHNIRMEEVYKMKFDVIISNPPYQLSDGGSGPSAMPLYNKFVEQAKKMNPRYLSMIIPSRWFAGGKGLDTFRNSMLSDDRLRQIVDYETSKDCFSGVNIAGGICYFLWDRDHHGLCKITNVTGSAVNIDTRSLNEYPIFIRSNEAVKILRKVLSKETDFMDTKVLTQKPYGFRTYARGDDVPFKDCITLVTSVGKKYVSRSDVIKNADSIDKYKVIIGRLVPSNGELDVKPGDGYRVITNTTILAPGEINTESYITIGTFDTKKEANNFNDYIKSKLPRFLLRQAVSSVNINREVFKFVPYLDFNKRWDDDALYKRYNLSKSEIEYIEKTIRSFNDDSIKN